MFFFQFKEFHEYLVMPPSGKNAADSEKLRDLGIEALKTATRRYARKQIKWINHRFLAQTGRQVRFIRFPRRSEPGPNDPGIYFISLVEMLLRAICHYLWLEGRPKYYFPRLLITATTIWIFCLKKKWNLKNLWTWLTRLTFLSLISRQKIKR